MNVFINASHDPWVYLPIHEQDFSVVSPILSEVFTSERVDDPIEVGLNSILVVAVLDELSLVPRIHRKHRQHIVTTFSVWVSDSITLKNLVSLIEK